jgi:transposase
VLLRDQSLLDESTKGMLARIVELEQELAKQRTVAAQLSKAKAEAEAELAKLRHAYLRALEQLQLMRRRLFVAKAERKDTAAEQLAFEGMLAELDQLEQAIAATEAAAKLAEAQAAAAHVGDGAQDGLPQEDKGRAKPKGRRNLEEAKLPEVRLEITDPELEGKAERIGFEESYRLGYERGGARRIVLARVLYKLPASESESTDGSQEPKETGAGGESDVTNGARLVTAPLPKELFRRGLLAPSIIARILVQKFVMGVPFYRLEESFAHEGAALDRGTMCRYAEDAGATLGAIVLTMRDEALAEAFCLSTDATGVAILPERLPKGQERKRQACHKGHFFVTLADRDHVFFEYQPRHTSAAVCEMFEGYSGYIQADAHAVYDALFRGPTGTAGGSTAKLPTEVGCWSHARRKWWDAATCKYKLGIEGLKRIDVIFAADRALAKLAPWKRKILRQEHVRPLVDAFFVWVETVYAQTLERGLIATAAGYAVRQKAALRRFLDDGRLRLENNGAERALRRIATGRKAWMFCGSHDHARAAANIFSLVASCKLHGLDPELYLAEVIRVMPYWPRDRYLELCPKHWPATRARLNAAELALPLGHITVPDVATPEQQQLTH